MNWSGNQRLITALFFLTLAPPAWAEHPFARTETSAIGSFLDTNFADADAAMVIGIIDTQGTRVFSAGSLDNGVSVEGKSLLECIEIMKGPEGTKVVLEVLDPTGDHSKTVESRKQKFLTSSG